MSYTNCCKMATTFKHWQHVVFLLRKRLSTDILQRNGHTMLINENFSARFRECCSKVDKNRHYYHKSSRPRDNDFNWKSLKNNVPKQNSNSQWTFEDNYFKNHSPHLHRHRNNSVNRSRLNSYNFFNGNGQRKDPSHAQYENVEFVEPPSWESENLPEITRNCYVPHPDVTSRDPSVVQSYREENKITISGGVVFNPIQSFSETNFPSYILKEFQIAGFEKPTPIQAQAWPIIMSGYNLIGIGETGSGKTIGYVVPAILHINRQRSNNKQNGPIVVILEPTRELAQQTCSVTFRYGRPANIQSVCLFGGQAPVHQLNQLRVSPQICVATPGRLLDFLQRGHISLKECTYLVVDEADRMLDMGFEPQVRQILEYIRPDRQIVMWSASWPPKIVPLAKKYIQNPVNIAIGHPDGGANKNITQIVDVCPQKEKMERLKQLLRKIYQDCKENAKILLFVNTKQMAEILSRELDSCGYRTLYLHGGKTQASRDFTIQKFRNARDRILIATDVAARGLDVPDIDYVINMDCPRTSDDYIHRIGRTARSGSKGISHTFITYAEASLAQDLINILEDSNQEVNPELLKLAN